jgi:hypothetical protein
MNVDEVIETLNSFDLKNVSNEEVLFNVRSIGKMALLGVTIPKGTFVNRSRADVNFNCYYYEDDITYLKPPKLVSKFNRASLKGDSIFYGCVPIDEDESFCQMLSFAEVSNILGKDSEDRLEEYVTIGKWRVVEDFTVAAIAYHRDFLEINKELKAMNENYLKFVKDDPKKEKDFLKISEFLSGEFAKPVSEDERYKYKISGSFSKVIMELGASGILYPSSKAEGKGFNLALNPTTVDKCLRLEKIMVCRARKRKNNQFVQPYLICTGFHPSGKFVWKDPDQPVPLYIIEKHLSSK